MSIEELENTIEGCKNGSRLSQKRLYHNFYGYAMSISMRYAGSREEAQEVCQDGFVKAFSKIDDCAGVGSFKGWLRRIFVNTAIDYYRKQRGRPFFDDIDTAIAVPAQTEPTGFDKISIDEKLAMVAHLPTAYRLAFNLYAVEGFSTAEIAATLQIAEGTVRSNLAKARFKLQKMIEASEQFKHTAQ